MILDLSKYENWCAKEDDKEQAILVYEILSVTGWEEADISKDEALEVLVDWPVNKCERDCDTSTGNLGLYSYVTNELDKSDADNPFVYQVAKGVWSETLVNIMKNLQLIISQKENGNYILLDANINADLGDSWKISRWEIQYDAQVNPLPKDYKKLFCDEVTWEKIFNDVLVTVVTRHGWREY